MAKSRYSTTAIIDGKSYEIFSLRKAFQGPGSQDLLAGVSTIDHVFKVGERLDTLAFKYMGDEQYWWVIALVNNIDYPFASGGLVPGVHLKIPRDPKDIIDRVI